MIRKENNILILETNNTTYAFHVMETGHLEHIYYGRKIRLPQAKNGENLLEKKIFLPGTTLAYDPEHVSVGLDDLRLEMSSYGKGDLREPFIEVVHGDGSFTSDFLYEDYTIYKGKIKSYVYFI